MDEDLTAVVLRARASRLGRDLDAGQLQDLRDSIDAVEPVLAAVRAQPIPLLSGQTDHVWGDVWLRRRTEQASAPQRQAGEQS
ncbi:hypothetical protein GCM10023215_54670 [Pseudonocardia yuanmonensis]|uniref:Uncharacterized protein n=1 Tax=Pseudonocardia yuanmonensis TaxID=1095914 RepID=A0ABP8XJ41_9PSEU